ncbi:phosphatidylinositol 4-phosphate 3-kinase C2 domain-containing subunit beta isoform X2 [Aethina tumida]|uniref:phosphatidylinositol 4-phosphate 3-kinase C2 domain-containing subunit beta isoform X2 n=1 Tax=Aethina tumida TaxID=116153 RepID=UPI00096B14D4|nr:phosphatidylinositol 4-phosphate 3-kinase C2 domain-containing subunit beta isoform X2 [Aethina tumida]
MSNLDKQYEEDLERAQALSLESLALEQFRRKKIIQESKHNMTPDKVKVKNSTVRASSMKETESQQAKYDFQLSRPRPGGGGSTGSPAGSLLAPPPSSQRKQSSSSFDSGPDLISFSSPPTSTHEIINFCNQQIYNSSTTVAQPRSPYNIYQGHLEPPLLFGIKRDPMNPSPRPKLNMTPNMPMMQHYPATPPAQINTFQPVRTSPVPYVNNPVKQIQPPPLPAKNTTKYTPVTKRVKDTSNNLIDFLQPTGQVRVSILDEFDPLSSSSTHRATSPECQVDDGASVCDSVYGDYDPYDYIQQGSSNNSLIESIYATVNRPEHSPQSPPPPLPPRAEKVHSLLSSNSDHLKGELNLLEKVGKSGDQAWQIKDPDLKEFYEMVYKLRNDYRHNEVNRNIGLIVSPMIKLRCPEDLSVKLCVHPDFDGAQFDSPIYFTCAVSTSVEHVTLQLICNLEAPSDDNYTLKVKGYDEYLVPTSLLSDYEYVHNCIKLEEDIVLILIPDRKKEKPFARTSQDDIIDKHIKFHDIIPCDMEPCINYDSLIILLETLESEMKKLEEAAKKVTNKTSPMDMPLTQPQKVTQSVKCVVNLMGNLYTLDIMDSVEELQKVCSNSMASNNLEEDVKRTCNKIRLAVLNLVEMYSSAFSVDFEIKTPPAKSEVLYVQDVQDSVLIRVCSIYRPPVKWKYHSYNIDVRICHGTRTIHKICYQNDYKYKIEQDFWPGRIVVDSWFQFDEVKINSLARETRLVIVLHGRTLDESDSNDNGVEKFQEEEIGWASVQFFGVDRKFRNGNILLSIWPAESNFLHHGPASESSPAGSPMIGVEILSPSNIEFPKHVPTFPLTIGDFKSLDNQTQEVLMDVCSKNMLYKIPPTVREVLWEKRNYLFAYPEALPKVLLAARSWAYSDLSELHAMVNLWKPLKPIQALELLLPTYPDLEVRKLAVKLICGFPEDELIDYLPQLVVALRFETYDTSSLAQMLLEYSLRSPRFAHCLFWLLSHKLRQLNDKNWDQNENLEIRYLRRMRLMYRSLIAICGEALRKTLFRQDALVTHLDNAALAVQQAKDQPKKCLSTELIAINEFLNYEPTSLPLSPSLRVIGIDVHTSSYFPSNTLPLKINFIMKDTSMMSAIYKVGDDLQQDMLTLQMVRLMDKLWLNEGLDLKIVTFKCVPTSDKKGMIEMVTNAETLRKIQTEHGLTGSFKDKPIAEWLGKHNPSELEYERAVQNFTASCAGYCVATYILGICDRHNDNIMLKTSGHLFHIDFGKFLGDAQMFKNFKRDRVPFVLTSDMAYVINGGDKPTEKFHRFVDLCCQAFNIIRNNANLLICLFTMMASSSAIAGVTADSVQYLKEALLLRNEDEVSNAEAAAKFARMIQSSLKSWFTQVNFFLHNIAQLKFSSETDDCSVLSFVPKVYSKDVDGKIVDVEVLGYKKRYDPDKYYVYLLKVYRENSSQPMIIQRTYKELCELHQKLCMAFPLATLSSLTTGLHMGRSNIKQVAEKRVAEITRFISTLLMCADEIRQSNLVFTFFHPLLRDQQDDHSKKLKDNTVHVHGKLSGQIKLAFQFSKDAFTVMVHHVRGLPRLSNGQEPSTYVKIYLRPDDNKETKRKTKVVKRNCHPSFMEMLVYRLQKDRIQDKKLQATVWNYDALQENEFMGGVELDLSNFNLEVETTEWYPLGNLVSK